jgi:acetyl coenzyme A synthetase (ADP forming)-like protein
MAVDLDKIHCELKYFFQPKSVAVIGASHNPEKVGYGVLKNLLAGGTFPLSHLKGFPGQIFAVNPKIDNILGLKCYPRITDISQKVDLAIVCVPARLVPRVLKDCVIKGVKGVTIISAGFGELAKKGKALQEEFLKIAKEGKIRIIGPNCLGTLYPPKYLNASFGPFLPLKGRIAFISQSGALVDSIVDWSLKERYGFSAVISYGNKSDLDAPDFIAWAARDSHTRAIALYIEGFTNGRYFFEVAKKVTPFKPIILLKAGKTTVGTRAVKSHTGSLAGKHEVYKGVCKQAGVIMADTLTQMFDMAKALAHQPPARGNRIAIITNGGGNGVMCADYCEELGVNLVKLPEEIIRKLDRSGEMHPAWSRANPLDVVGDASPQRYKVALSAIMSSKYYDGVIVIQTLQSMTKPIENARVVVEMQKRYRKPVVSAFIGGAFTEPGVKFLEEHNIPNFNDLDRAAKAIWALTEYGTYHKTRR